MADSKIGFIKIKINAGESIFIILLKKKTSKYWLSKIFFQVWKKFTEKKKI